MYGVRVWACVCACVSVCACEHYPKQNSVRLVIVTSANGENVVLLSICIFGGETMRLTPLVLTPFVHFRVLLLLLLHTIIIITIITITIAVIAH